MDYWRDGNEWNYYSENRPRRVEGGIKPKSERGAIGGDTWWSKRWIKVLETLGIGTRLARGRLYARQGQVLSIDVQPGSVKARVQGSLREPYKIKIQLQPLSEQDWDKVSAVMSERAIFAAKLLAGEMPTNIEEAFGAVNLALFPTTEKDLVTACSCPDWANPCKHTAAVYYILAERFDEDPFLIFKLRGRSKEAIVEALRKKRVETLPASTGRRVSRAVRADAAQEQQVLRLEDNLSNFWQAGEGLDTFEVNPHNPSVDKAILKRLGDAPFMIGHHNARVLLASAYDAVHDAAMRKAEDLPS